VVLPAGAAFVAAFLTPACFVEARVPDGVVPAAGVGVSFFAAPRFGAGFDAAFGSVVVAMARSIATCCSAFRLVRMDGY
jgi:hypothetical protein